MDNEQGIVWAAFDKVLGYHDGLKAPVVLYELDSGNTDHLLSGLVNMNKLLGEIRDVFPEGIYKTAITALYFDPPYLYAGKKNCDVVRIGPTNIMQIGIINSIDYKQPKGYVHDGILSLVTLDGRVAAFLVNWWKESAFIDVESNETILTSDDIFRSIIKKDYEINKVPDSPPETFGEFFDIMDCSDNHPAVSDHGMLGQVSELYEKLSSGKDYFVVTVPGSTLISMYKKKDGPFKYRLRFGALNDSQLLIPAAYGAGDDTVIQYHRFAVRFRNQGTQDLKIVSDEFIEEWPFDLLTCNDNLLMLQQYGKPRSDEFVKALAKTKEDIPTVTVGTMEKNETTEQAARRLVNNLSFTYSYKGSAFRLRGKYRDFGPVNITHFDSILDAIGITDDHLYIFLHPMFDNKLPGLYRLRLKDLTENPTAVSEEHLVCNSLHTPYCFNTNSCFYKMYQAISVPAGFIDRFKVRELESLARGVKNVC